MRVYLKQRNRRQTYNRMVTFDLFIKNNLKFFLDDLMECMRHEISTELIWKEKLNNFETVPGENAIFRS